MQINSVLLQSEIANLAKGVRFHGINESEVGEATGKWESVELNKQV